ncbi:MULTISPECIES: MobC family plasmid mobilization relaxosome protein [Lactococcus]|uniref:MobC family plasmid mobilization relaxosome protein n=1 Tax=Lactococcus petauri TaxID=1940789 RepID=UPI001F5A7EA1|nr:MobC family plasmid mobilization relaxosome protein [Lactococcus petauri]
MENKQKLKRPHQKIVRFDEAELSFLKRRVEESPFNNFQNYARILLLTGEVKVVDYSELRHLNGEINRIGNNINQLAKLAHQFDEISEEDVSELLDELREIKALVSQKFKEELKQERLV